MPSSSNAAYLFRLATGYKHTKTQTMGGCRMKRYYPNVDSLKGIGITLVILGHAIILFPVNLHQIAWCRALFNTVSMAHMQLLFILSGFCYVYNGNYAGQLRKKSKRLLVPYIAFNLLDCIPRSMMPFLVNRPKPIGECLYSMIFLGGEYWFLYVLFTIFLIFPCLVPCMKKKAGAAGSLLVLFTIHLIPGIPAMFRLKDLFYYMFYFAFGYAIKTHIHTEQLYYMRTKWKTAATCVVLFFLWIIGPPVCAVYTSPWVQDVFVFATCGFWAVLIQVVPAETLWRPFRAFGRYSLQLYLLNGFMLTASRTLIIRILHCDVPVLIVARNMLVDLVLSYIVITRILAKWKPLRVISGIV